MKVLHIGLCSHFTDKMQYQDNILPEMNIKQGHDVTYISDVYEYKEGVLVETDECDIVLDNGLRLIRVRYDKVINSLITKKIQKARKIIQYINEIQPDSILYHGVCGFEMMDVARYVKSHPNVLFYMDSHEDFGNTARSRVAKLFYKYVHGHFVKKALPYVNKILYLGEDCKYFLKEIYNISESILDFFPLGGIIQSKEEQKEAKKELTRQFNILEDTIVFMHSGKMIPEKKTTNLIRSFSKITKPNIALFIFGSVPEEYKKEFFTLIGKDDRIRYLGWKKGKEIINLLNAADVYCQPGTPSATSQVALCCGCAEIICPTISYRIIYENAVLYAENDEELFKQLVYITDKNVLSEYKEKGFSRACEILDYYKLAERYLV